MRRLVLLLLGLLMLMACSLSSAVPAATEPAPAGEPLATLETSASATLDGLDVGLLGGAFDQGGVEILFDDFKVSTP